jgi:hypothetical protein
MRLRLESPQPHRARPAAALDVLAGARLASPVVRSLLRGDWLGHAVHPLLSDVAIGTFLGATFRDLLGADQDEHTRRRLVLAGIAAAIPPRSRTPATGADPARSAVLFGGGLPGHV